MEQDGRRNGRGREEKRRGEGPLVFGPFHQPCPLGIKSGGDNQQLSDPDTENGRIWPTGLQSLICSSFHSHHILKYVKHVMKTFHMLHELCNIQLKLDICLVLTDLVCM